MRFIRPIRFEIFLVRLRADEFQHEVLICEITEDYQIVWHAPVELFLRLRNMAIIYGIGHDGDVISKDLMQVGTKKQEYARWEPILTSADFESMVHRKINMELGKAATYKSDPNQYSFYKEYAEERMSSE